MRHVVRFLVWTAVILGAIVAIARAIAIRWWRVPSDDPELVASIAPTLAGGDLVLLWRLTRPGVGDLVLCPDPDQPEHIIIGRIAGEEGNEVSVSPGAVTVDGKAAVSDRNCSPAKFEVEDPATGEPIEQFCQIEELRGVAHKYAEVPPQLPAPRGDSETVERGKVYLLSDNRAFPFDSRHYGTVSRDSCTEVVFFRLVSKNGYFDSEPRFTLIQ